VAQNAPLWFHVDKIEWFLKACFVILLFIQAVVVWEQNEELVEETEVRLQPILLNTDFLVESCSIQNTSVWFYDVWVAQKFRRSVLDIIADF
jgi:hypothetical protein